MNTNDSNAKHIKSSKWPKIIESTSFYLKAQINKTKCFTILPAIILSTGIILGGCSGSGGSSGNNNGNGDQIHSISGKVLGSLVEGALVCVDENENGRCDSTDGYRIFSGADGSYSIGDIPESLFEFPIVVEVPQSATIIDPVTGLPTQVATEYRLSYPPSDTDERFVSSLSTLVNSEFGRLGNLAAATDSVAAQLESAGIELGSVGLLDNYVDAATAGSATEDDIKLYNVAKLAGNTMRVAQQNTEGNSNVNAAVLMELVAEKVFDTIDEIERIARENQTLINQQSADTIVADLSQVVDLGVSGDDVQSAAQLASLPFDLGTVNRTKVWNFREGNDAALWVRRTSVRFNIPQDIGDMTLDEYRAQIPQSYEIGLLDEAGTLLDVQRFDQPNWVDGVDPKYYYELQENGTMFYMFTQSASVDAPVGDYRFVLCPAGCDGEGARIALGGQTVAPLNDELGLGNITMLDDLVQNDLRFTTSSDPTFEDGSNRLVYFSSTPPPHGSAYRFQLGIDVDMDGAPESTRARSEEASLDELRVPSAWISDSVDHVVRVSHRDTLDYEDMSWEARTLYHPTEINIASGLAVDEIWDLYYARYEDDGSFEEGFRVDMRIFHDENNPLSSLEYLDENDSVLVDVCLPDDLPETQADLATYSVGHSADGAGYYFPGCQGFNLYDEFGLNGDTSWTWMNIKGDTSYDFDAEVLMVEMQFSHEDSDQLWGEPGDVSGQASSVRLTFQDGHQAVYPLDVPRPDHVLSPHGEPDVTVCSLDAEHARFSWTPPDWMQDDFNAGDLSNRFRIRARNENGNTLGRFDSRTQMGATSTVVNKAVLRELDAGDTIARFSVEANLQDNNYSGNPWRHQTYRTKINREMTATEVLAASSCD